MDYFPLFQPECHDTCAECTGPGNDDCTECQDGHYQQPAVQESEVVPSTGGATSDTTRLSSEEDTFECVVNCSQGFYPSSDTLVCKACLDAMTNCTECEYQACDANADNQSSCLMCTACQGDLLAQEGTCTVHCKDGWKPDPEDDPVRCVEEDSESGPCETLWLCIVIPVVVVAVIAAVIIGLIIWKRRGEKSGNQNPNRRMSSAPPPPSAQELNHVSGPSF